MKTVVLRKMGYEGTFIYILQFNYTFQYLFAWKNEVYRQEVTISPVWYSWRKWAWAFSIVKHPYSQHQLEQGEQILLSGAMKSIDALKADPKGEQRQEAERVATAKVKSNSACQWQAVTDEDKPMFWCMTHEKSAPLDDNPKHD